MSLLVAGFQDLDKSHLLLAGGKGANLGELSRIEGIHVPDGFLLSTEAYRNVTGDNPLLNRLLDHLSFLRPADRKEIGELGAEIRGLIEEIPVPQDIREEITRFLGAYQERQAFAIRSSATAEDLPATSFAGQQDTYLNIIGKDAILQYISKCWAALYTERAIVYRLRNGFDQRKVQLAVVVQKMVFPQAAGIMFTADPVSGNRKVLSVDAGVGLGEAMVSGLVNTDNYAVRDGKVIGRKIAAKRRALYAREEGGLQEQVVESGRQSLPAIPDEQVIALEQIGRKIEAHFGSPQDIEWCLAGGRIYIVQSRPITTLFPIPAVNDRENHVYVSVGHQQMMTDPITGW